ncbi:hypothetical protein SS1G_11553 [Sclerotinia sclerotiorum 1980 UF-70]|uniref:Cytochrome P450 n=1 Tax=Sclerotinia sclerotiorum (strain ATCC 18683 / 1980 / Ss-1) TaxID=665079 RepID=A7F1T2_SCLS1|nr:hypothetical protein SS1G_11553 [Sclerotinia sclerotiorum 1980 UF-70]EDN95674.1 hypothetical protein SS1G_11553 [Sclerotinia sclerotiorum 1980 UF-70]
MFSKTINQFLGHYLGHNGNELELASIPFHFSSSFLAVAITWATWRFWKFTLKPALYPEDPKEYPYFIPGQAPAFLRDSQSLFKRAREYFGNTREPFAITIMGQQIYVVTNPEDLPTLYKSTSTLTFDGFIKDFFKKEGVTPEAIEIMFTKQAKSQKKVLAHAGEDFFKQQLQPGGHLQPLFNSIQMKISEVIQWDKLSQKAVISTIQSTKKVSLLAFCHEMLVKPVSTAVFGNVLYEVEPNLSEIYRKFDDNSWKMNYELPRLVAPDVYDAKDEIRSVMLRYIQLPSERRSDAAWILHALENELRGAGISEEDIASFFFGPFWTINGNAYKHLFWVLSYILFDSALHKSILTEVEPAVAVGLEGLDSRLEACPRLVATYEEVLRMNTSSVTVRDVLADTKMGKVILRKGAKVFAPTRQLHFDPLAFGTNVDQFDPERFLRNKKLNKSNSFRPFGGGITHCPGRWLAMKEILVCVALVLSRFEVELDGAKNGSEAQPFPKVDTTMLALGVLPPKKGEDVLVSLRQK